MNKIIFIIITSLACLIFPQTIIAEPQNIQVSASVPLTDAWKKAIANNSQARLSLNPGSPSLEISLKGVSGVAIPRKQVLVSVLQKNRLIYQAKSYSDLSGRTRFSLPETSLTDTRIQVICIYQNQWIYLQNMPNLDKKDQFLIKLNTVYNGIK